MENSGNQVTVVESGTSSKQDSGKEYTFTVDEAEMEKAWQEIAARVETTVSFTETKDEKTEAAYWDNLEKWLLKGYQNQAKKQAMQIAKVEFMLKTLTKQMEANFRQNFDNWSNHFNVTVNNLFTTRIPRIVSDQVQLAISEQTQEIKMLVIDQIQRDLEERVQSVVNLKVSDQSQDIKQLVIEQMGKDIEDKIEQTVTVKTADKAQDINVQVIQQVSKEFDARINNIVDVKLANQRKEISLDLNRELQKDIDDRIAAVVNLKIVDQSQNLKNQVIREIQSYLDQRIKSIINQSRDTNVHVVVNELLKDLDNRISVNLDNKILNFRDDLPRMIKNQIDISFVDNLKSTILSDIRKQQFYVDMQSIKAEVENFYGRLAQFESELYLRIEQGDTQLYNWTLEQLISLQGCLTDRQALVEMFEAFAGDLKDKLEYTECVQPTQFTPWVRTDMQSRFESQDPDQLPGV